MVPLHRNRMEPIAAIGARIFLQVIIELTTLLAAKALLYVKTILVRLPILSVDLFAALFTIRLDSVTSLMEFIQVFRNSTLQAYLHV